MTDINTSSILQLVGSIAVNVDKNRMKFIRLVNGWRKKPLSGRIGCQNEIIFQMRNKTKLTIYLNFWKKKTKNDQMFVKQPSANFQLFFTLNSFGDSLMADTDHIKSQCNHQSKWVKSTIYEKNRFFGSIRVVAEHFFRAKTSNCAFLRCVEVS